MRHIFLPGGIWRAWRKMELLFLCTKISAPTAKQTQDLGFFRSRLPAPVFYALLHAGEGGAFVPAGSICRLSLTRSFNATCAAASLAMGTRNGEQLT